MFDIQMFGDNDTVTSSFYGAFEFGFVDDDTRTIHYPNVKLTTTSEEVAELSQWMIDNNVIIGDKNGADSNGINSLIIVQQTKRKLDITD